MTPLKSEEHASLDISTLGTALTFQYLEAAPRTVICRLTIGSSGKPIAGNGAYVVITFINDRRVSPDSRAQVSASVNQTLLQSRELLLAQNDTIRVAISGQSNDSDVYSLAELVDVTPMSKAEIFGTGSIPVDHNYGGEDHLRVLTASNAPVAAVSIIAYRKSDYLQGYRSSDFVIGQTLTNDDGRWQQPLLLDPGDYTIVFGKVGVIRTKTVNLTVT